MALNANALVTLALTKKWLKIPVGETSMDDMVELLINSFSQEVESKTSRKLKSQTVTDYKHGRGTNIVLLKEWPVTAITSIHIDADAVFGVDELVPAADYILGDDDNSVIYLAGLFPRGYHNIKIVYTAGYADVPSDLQQAVLDLCFWKFRTRESGDIGRIQKGKESESEQWSQEWPKGITEIVMRYKRTEMPGIDAPVQNY